MDASEIANLVSTVGFPIVAFGLMYYMCTDTLKGVQNALIELTKTIESLKSDVQKG